MKVKTIRDALRKAGFVFIEDKIETEHSTAFVFTDEKTVITVYHKHNEYYRQKYPDMRICSFVNLGVPTSAKKVVGWAKQMLKGNISQPPVSAAEKEEMLGVWAEEMRQEPTDAERAFRDLLIKKGIPFETQTPVRGRYIVDFILYDKVVVEVDGAYHFTWEQRKRDTARTSLIEKGQYIVLRCSNGEVMTGEFKDPLLAKILS